MRLTYFSIPREKLDEYSVLSDDRYLNPIYVLLRGTIVSRTYGIRKNLPGICFNYFY